MSRLLSPLLLAALCWVSGHHCLENRICNWVKNPSKSCMLKVMGNEKVKLDDRIDITPHSLSGERNGITYQLTSIHVTGVKNITVRSLSWRDDDVNKFQKGSVSKVTRTDLTLEWPGLKLVMGGTFAKCQKRSCKDYKHGSITFDLNPPYVEISWLTTLASDEKDPRPLRLSSVGISVSCFKKSATRMAILSLGRNTTSFGMIFTRDGKGAREKSNSSYMGR